MGKIVTFFGFKNQPINLISINQIITTKLIAQPIANTISFI